jgi:hypothetical protein
MMLGVSVGVVVVGWVGIVYVLSSATSTYNSMTAWTSLVGVLSSGSISAMLEILKSSASTAYFTMLLAFISSTLWKRLKRVLVGYSDALTFSSY